MLSAHMTYPPILHGSASYVPQRVRPSLLAVPAMKAVPGRTAAGEFMLEQAVGMLLTTVFLFNLFLPYRLCQGASALLDRQCPCYRHAARRERVAVTQSSLPQCLPCLRVCSWQGLLQQWQQLAPSLACLETACDCSMQSA